MPALPSVPNVLRIDQIFHLGEDLKAKTREFWKYASGPPTSAELSTMAAAVRVAFASDLASLMAAGYQLLEVIVTDLSSSTAAQGNDTTAVNGTRTGSPATAAACVLESRHIARRFRGGHSRIYWPFGTSTDEADPQTWGTVFIGDVSAGLASYATAIDSAINAWGTSQGPVAVSFYEGFTVHTGVTGRARNVSTPRTSPVVDPVTSGTVQHGIAVQRKRLLHLA